MTYFKIRKKSDPVAKSVNLDVKVGSEYDLQLNTETLDYDYVSGSYTVSMGDGGGELKN